MASLFDQIANGEVEVGTQEEGKSSLFEDIASGKKKVTGLQSKKAPWYEGVGDLLKKGGEVGLGGLEGVGNLVGGAALWGPSQLAKYTSIGVDKLSDLFGVEEKSPEAVLQTGRDIEKDVASYFGALPGPETPVGQGISNVAGKVFETILTPGHWLVDKIVPEGYPNLKEFADFASELATFKVAHAGSNLFKGKMSKLKGAVEEGNLELADSLAKELKALSEEEGVTKSLRTAQERQNYINKKTLGTAELRQAFIDEYGSFDFYPEDPIAKAVEKASTEVKNLPKEEVGSPLIKRGAEDVQRTNKEAAQHEELRQAISARLEQNRRAAEGRAEERRTVPEAPAVKEEVSATPQSVAEEPSKPIVEEVPSQPQREVPKETSKGYHSTKEMFMPSIEKEGLRPITLNETIDSVISKLDLSPEETKVAKEVILKDDYFSAGDRPLEEKALFLADSPEAAKSFISGEGYNAALFALKSSKEIPKQVRSKAKKLLQEWKDSPQVILEADFPGTLKRGDNVTQEILKARRVSEREVPSFQDREASKNDYSLYGRKKFASEKEARAYLDENAKVLKAREELNAEGRDLEVIKVGNEYRLAEPLVATEAELKALEEGLRKIEGERTENSLRYVKPDEIVDHLKMIDEGIKSKEVDLYSAEKMVEDLFDAAERSGDSQLMEGVGQGLEFIRKLQRELEARELEKIQPKASSEGLMKAQHPTKMVDDAALEVVYSPDGSPFSSPFDAADFLKENGLVGTVDKSPIGSGFVIELRKPEGLKPFPFEDRTKMTLEELKEADRIDAQYLEASKDSWSSLINTVKKIFESQKGELNIDFSDPKFDRLKKLVLEAGKKGLDVKSFLMGIGYDMKAALQAEALVKAYAGRKDVTEVSPSIKGFSKGEVVNGPSVVRTFKGQEIKKVPVYAEELQGLMDLNELTGVTSKRKNVAALQEVVGEMVPTSFRMDEMGKMGKQLQKTYWDIVDRISSRKKEVFEQLRAVSKGLSRESKRNITLNALWKQPTVQFRMKESGFTEADIPKLSLQEQRVYDFMRSKLEPLGQEINSIRTSIGKNPIKLLDDYFTLMYAEGQAGLKLGNNPLLDPSHSMNYNYQQFLDKSFKYTKRGGKKLFGVLEEDALKTFVKYVGDAIDYTEMAPFIAKLKEFQKPFDLGEGKTFRLRDAKPNTAKWLRRWANHLAGRDAEALFTQSRSNRRVENRIRKVSSNIASAMMSFLVRSGPVQFGAFRNTIAEVGFGRTSQGILKAMQPGNFREALKESSLLRNSFSEAEYRDFLKPGIKGKVVDLGTKHIKYMDAFTRVSTYLGAKEMLAKKGLRGKELISETEHIVSRTQATGLPGDIAPIQRSAVGKALYLLQTFTLNDWNYLYKDVLGFKDGGKLSKGQRARKAFNYVLGTTLLNSLFEDVLDVNSPFPTPVRAIQEGIEEGKSNKDIIEDVLLEVLSPIPGVFGGLRYGSSTFGLVVDTMDSAVEAMREGRYDKMTEMGFRVGGVPGTSQMFKSLRQVKKGETNPWTIIMGQPPQKKEGNRRGPSL